MWTKSTNFLAVVESCKMGLSEDIKSLSYTQFACFGHRIEGLPPVQDFPAHFVCWSPCLTIPNVGTQDSFMLVVVAPPRGEREWLLRVREREGNWKSPFPKFGNGKGIKKSIPKFREWEGNEKIPFPKFGNGKGMKKIHSQNSGTGREWKNPFPKFGKGNQRPPFLGMTGNGNGNGNNILFTFLDFFFLGLPWKFLPQNLFLTPPHV